VCSSDLGNIFFRYRSASMRISIGVSLAFALAVSSIGFAQNRREERREERAAPAAGGASAEAGRGSADQQIAACLYGANRNEIELSRLAQDKASSEAVREFAAMMVKDHSPVLEKLQAAAGPLVSAQAPGTPAAGERRAPSRREPRAKDESEAPAAAPSATRAPAGAGPADIGLPGAPPTNRLDWVAIHKQIADQCLASTKADFQRKEGAEFDQCYMGHQIMAHMKVLDEIKVLRNQASAELRKDLDESSQMASHHLEEAKKIADGLKSQDTKRVSRKPKAE